MKKIIKIQSLVLLIGTVFALTNFANLLFAWLNSKDCINGCLPPEDLVNPFFAAEFYAALFLILALLLNLILWIGSRESKEKVSKPAKEEKREELPPADISGEAG